MRNTCGGNGLPLAYASCAVFNQTPSLRWGLYAVARIRELNRGELDPFAFASLTRDRDFPGFRFASPGALCRRSHSRAALYSTYPPSSRWGLYAVARIRELNPAGLAVARIRELTQPVLKPRGSASLHPGLYAVPS